MFLSLLIIAIIIIITLSVLLFCYMLNPFHLRQFEQTGNNYKEHRSRKSSNSTESNDASTKYCSDDNSAVITVCNGFGPNEEKEKTTDHYDSVRHNSNCNGNCVNPTAPTDNNNIELHNVEHHNAETPAVNSTDV